MQTLLRDCLLCSQLLENGCCLQVGLIWWRGVCRKRDWWKIIEVYGNVKADCFLTIGERRTKTVKGLEIGHLCFSQLTFYPELSFTFWMGVFFVLASTGAYSSAIGGPNLTPHKYIWEPCLFTIKAFTLSRNKELLLPSLSMFDQCTATLLLMVAWCSLNIKNTVPEKRVEYLWMWLNILSRR